MAEERLIDDDKDKKYKIRKNAQGEDELYLDESAEEEVTFEIPEFETDDEEAALLTPEQLAERERMRAEAERKRAEKLSNAISQATEDMANGNYEAARYHLAEVAETEGDNGEVRYLQLKALTHDFTDYTLAEEAAEVSKAVKAHCTAEQKAALKEISASLSERLEKVEKEMTALGEENEAKKAERRQVFTQKRKKSLIYFSATAIPLVIFAIVAAIVGNMIYTRKDSTVFIIVTIVFGVLALIALVATLFTARNLWMNSQKVKRNESNKNTRLGRDYEAKKAEFNYLTEINDAINL